MKRIIFLICMMTIALASVCWADELTGVWKLESMDVVEIEPGAENADKLKEMAKTPIDYDAFLTIRDDGTMVEFQDFKVWQQLLIFVRAKVYLDITFKFYDSKLQKELYTYTKKNCICKKVFPLNLDVSSDKKLEIKARF